MKQQATCPNREDLQRLRRGELPFVRVEELAEHLERCDACARTLGSLPGEDTLVDVLHRAGAAAGAAPDTVVENLIERLRHLKAPAATVGGEEPTLPPGGESSGESYPFLAPPRAAGEQGGLGPYRVLAVLGSGGMGVVFLADDPRLKRRVALKVIRPELARRPEVRERFLREAQAVARVEHDNIVTILHVDEAGGVPFLAMPLLRGESLEERLARRVGPLPIDDVLRIAREAASGLAAAHDHGLIHRDVKPANIYLTLTAAGNDTLPGGDPAPSTGPDLDNAPYKVKILDFGLARSSDAEGAPLSKHDQVIGTPAYMAPEQARGQVVDARADLFSLGCVLYRMTTGRPPFQGTDVIAVLMSIAVDDPPPARSLNPDLPPELATLIDKLLAKQPQDRPPSAHAVVEAIEAIERRRAEGRRLSRRGLLIAAAIAVPAACVLGAVVAWWASRPAPPPPPEKPGEVAFEFDEPDVRLVLRRGDGDETIIDPRETPRKELPAGSYHVHPTAAKEGRELVPSEFEVKPGQSQTLVLRLVGEVAHAGGFASAVTGVAVSPKKDALTVVVSSLDANAPLAIWDGKSARVRAPADPAQQMACVALAPDGASAATGPGKLPTRGETAIHLWDIQASPPTVRDRLRGHTVSVTALAYSPKGTTLISGDLNGRVILWNLEKRDRLFTIDGHAHAVSGAAFSADGKRALTGGHDRRAVLWDATTGKEVRHLEHPGKVFAVAFGPAEDEVTTGCDDGLVRIWNLTGGKVVELKGHDGEKGGVKCVAVSPDGKRLLSGGEDGTLRLWDAPAGREIYVFRPGAAVNGVAFAAGGRRAVSGGSDRAVRLWELPN